MTYKFEILKSFFLFVFIAVTFSQQPAQDLVYRKAVVPVVVSTGEIMRRLDI